MKRLSFLLFALHRALLECAACNLRAFADLWYRGEFLSVLLQALQILARLLASYLVWKCCPLRTVRLSPLLYWALGLCVESAPLSCADIRPETSRHGSLSAPRRHTAHWSVRMMMRYLQPRLCLQLKDTHWQMAHDYHYHRHKKHFH